MPRKIISAIIILAAILLVLYGLFSKPEVKKTAFDSPITLLELPEAEAEKEPVISAIDKPTGEATGEIAASKPLEAEMSLIEGVEAPGVVAKGESGTFTVPETPKKSVAEVIAAPEAVAAAAIGTSTKSEETEGVVAEKAAEETVARVEENKTPVKEEAKAKAEENLPMAPDFTLPTYDGKSLTLSNLKGKRGVVLIFFATWCPGCMAEVDHVKEFVEASRDKDVLVFGVTNQDKETIDRFITERKINYRILFDKGSQVAWVYQGLTIPCTVGIDAAGVVRYHANRFPDNTELFIKVLTEPLRAQK